MLILLREVYPLFGWTGSLVILLGIMVALSFYRGKAGERYSLLNNFISELGEVGVSKAAWAFNTGMIIGGLFFLPLMVGFGMNFPSIWGKLGMIAGVVAALSAVFVGVFPMSNLTPHRFSAMMFFRSGLLTILLFTIAIFLQPANAPAIPPFVNIFSVLAIVCYTTFLAIVGQKMDKKGHENYILDPQQMPERPKFWRTAFLEWMIFFSTILWFLIISSVN